MKCSSIQSLLIAAILLLSASLSMAADKKPDASEPATGTAKASAADVNVKKPAVPVKAAKLAPKNLVDINSASKEALMKLPGIDAAAADKIIAGRPYLSKTHLVTQNVIARGVYENLKTQVIARQNKASAAKLEEMQKQAEKKKH